MTTYTTINGITKHISTVRLENPNMSIPDGAELSEIGLYLVAQTPMPEYDPATHRCYSDGAEQVNGQWQTRWTLEALAPKTEQEFIQEVTTATQARLDTFARTRNYDGILSACTYAQSSIAKFATEGQYCINVRDATWATLYTIMSEVKAGARPMPESADATIALLPALEWPT